MSQSKTFEVTYIEDESGSISVVPGTGFIKRNIEYGESLIGQGSAASDHAKSVLLAARESGLLKSKQFEMRPYTYGEKLEAQRKCTSLVNGEMRVDVAYMNLALLSAVTGVKEEDLQEESTPIINALYEEMQALSEPDPQRMLFLLGKSTSGESAVERKGRKSKEN